MKFLTVHLITYLITGFIAFNTFVKPLYFGDNPLFASFLATPDQEVYWALMLKKLLPLQIIRGLLLGMVFYSIVRFIRRQSYKRRFITFFGFYFIVGFLAGPAIGPGTLEGMVYMLPKFSPQGHALVFFEMLLQSLMLSFWMAWWMRVEGAAEKETSLEG
jgi:hypothetical protein